MTLGSLFDGIAGFPLAAQRQGIKTVWASEILLDCVDVAKKHFPDIEHLGDITKLNGAEIPPVDIISFGSPCQNLSTAGNGKGLEGSASCLFFEAVRIIDEMRCATNGKYPKYAVWENVAGAQKIDVQAGSCLTGKQLKEYAGSSGKPLWGWYVSEVKEYYTPHPLSLYGLKRPPQSWQYYRGEDVPDIMTINQLANICGYFFNAEFDPDCDFSPNNGYNCRHEGQRERGNGVGCCYQWSCPLENIIPADEEDCEKYGMDYEENEFVLVYRKGQR